MTSGESRTKMSEVKSISDIFISDFQCFVPGLTFLLYGFVIVQTAHVARMIGCLMAVSCLAYIAQGWVSGFEAFSETNAFPMLLDTVERPAVQGEFATTNYVI